MCEFSPKLVAWLDGELPNSEAADLDQHVRACDECRVRIDLYENVSGLVTAYCDARLAAEAPSHVPNWASALGAVAALVASLAVFPHFRSDRPSAHSLASVTQTVSSAPVAGAVTALPLLQAPRHLNRKLRKSATSEADSGSQSESRETGFLPTEPAIEIAVPGDALLPPGALPPGIGFVAEVSLGEDGSAQQLRLQPLLTSFEGGSNQ